MVSTSQSLLLFRGCWIWLVAMISAIKGIPVQCDPPTMKVILHLNEAPDFVIERSKKECIRCRKASWISWKKKKGRGDWSWQSDKTLGHIREMRAAFEGRSRKFRMEGGLRATVRSALANRGLVRSHKREARMEGTLGKTHEEAVSQGLLHDNRNATSRWKPEFSSRTEL